MEAAVQRMMGEQKARDAAGCDDEAVRAARTRERLADEAARIRDGLAAIPAWICDNGYRIQAPRPAHAEVAL